MEEKKECCCHHKTKERSDKEYKDLINRLSRIEGQVRGIKKMVENDTYCIARMMFYLLPERKIQYPAVYQKY